MLLRPIRLLLTIALLLTTLSALIPSGNVHALTDPLDGGVLLTLNEFIGQVSNGDRGVLSGIYIPGILAAQVVQQPKGRADFVSPWQNTVTQFSLASRFGSTGLLAHNYLAGEAFDLLRKGQDIQLIHGDGTISNFTVTEILRYQALDSDSTTSRFLDPNTNTSITSTELFTRVYIRSGKVILQTCIQADGDPSWGRLFVIAAPSN